MFKIGKNNPVMCAILITLSIAAVYADSPGGYAGAEWDNAPTAVEAAFGGATYSFNPEPSALATNPANMYSQPVLCAGASYENFSIDVSRYSLFAQTPIMGNFRLGAGLIQHTVGNIEARNARGAPLGSFSYRYQTYLVGATYGVNGGKISKPCETSVWEFSAGATAKISAQYLADTVEGAGISLDLGIAGKYLNFRYGVVIKNAYGVIGWRAADTLSERYPAALVAAVGWEYCASSWAEIALERRVSGRLRFRLGGQFMPTDWAALRAGIDFQKGTPTPIDEWRIAFGGAFYRHIWLPLEISYAAEYIRPIRKWTLAVGIGWNTF